jgi:uncharacterized membrane protein YfcA
MLQDLLLFLVGLIVGGMNAIAGGGMLIGFPVLLATGMPALAANVTSNIITLPGQISSAYGYREYLKRTPRRYLLLILPCIAGSIMGTTLLRHTSHDKFAQLVPVLILFAVVLFTFQPFLHRHVHRHLNGPKRHRQRMGPLLLIGLAMLPMSVYGGYFGAGFGFIMLAFLGFTKLHQIHQINALKNVMAISLVSTSIVCLYSTHLIDWHKGLCMAAGSFIGGYAGSKLAQRVPSHALRVLVIIIGIGTAGYLALRSY